MRVACYRECWHVRLVTKRGKGIKDGSQPCRSVHQSVQSIRGQHKVVCCTIAEHRIMPVVLWAGTFVTANSGRCLSASGESVELR